MKQKLATTTMKETAARSSLGHMLSEAWPIEVTDSQLTIAQCEMDLKSK